MTEEKILTNENLLSIQNFWNSTQPFDENIPYIALRNIGQKDVNALITTIESQKEEIERLKLSIDRIIYQEDEPILQEGEKP